MAIYICDATTKIDADLGLVRVPVIDELGVSWVVVWDFANAETPVDKFMVEVTRPQDIATIATANRSDIALQQASRTLLEGLHNVPR